MNDSVNFKIREVVKADALPVSPNTVVSLNNLSSLPHLQGVTIPKINQDKVSLLIGLDCPNAHRILDMREGDGTQPNAVKPHSAGRYWGQQLTERKVTRTCRLTLCKVMKLLTTRLENLGSLSLNQM